MYGKKAVIVLDDLPAPLQLPVDSKGGMVVDGQGPADGKLHPTLAYSTGCYSRRNTST